MAKIGFSRTWNTPCRAIVIASFCLLVMSGLCREVIAVEITATWSPGTGDWTDPRWTFAPPTAATFPDNGGGDFFDVLIDNGATGGSQVTLNRAIEIDRLEISPDDGLRLSGGGALTFTQDAARPGSGELINDSGSIVGSGFLGGAGPGSGSMLLDNRSGSIVADTGVLTINPSGFAGTTIPPITINNSGSMAAQNPGSTLILKNSFVQQTGPGSVETILGGSVVLEDSVVQGGEVRVGPNAPPLILGELLLNRGSIVEGTDVTVHQDGVVRVLASAFPGGTLPAAMKIQGGSILIEAGPINPVTLTLDSGPGPAHEIDFSNPVKPANPGRIITNWPTALPVEGTSVIKIVEGDVDLVNPAWAGGPRGGIFLNGAVPSAAQIVSDTGARTLTVGPGTILTTMPGRSGNIGPFIGPFAPVVIAKGNSPGGGLVAANTGGSLLIGELRNEGGMVQALSGGTLALGNDEFPNTGEVHIFAGGTLELTGDYQQIAESTLIEGTAIVGGSFIQTGGMTTVEPGGVLRAQEVEVQDGRFSGDILSDFLLDGSWNIQIRDLLDYDSVFVYDDPNTPSAEGFARIADGSRILTDLWFDAQIGDFFDILVADLLDVNLSDLSISDPFADQRFFGTSIVDYFDPVLGREREALRLEVIVPEPQTALMFILGLLTLAIFCSNRKVTPEGEDKVGPKEGGRGAR